MNFGPKGVERQQWQVPAPEGQSESNYLIFLFFVHLCSSHLHRLPTTSFWASHSKHKRISDRRTAGALPFHNAESWLKFWLMNKAYGDIGELIDGCIGH
jgi:hypothetical protein